MPPAGLAQEPEGWRCPTDRARGDSGLWRVWGRMDGGWQRRPVHLEPEAEEGPVEDSQPAWETEPQSPGTNDLSGTGSQSHMAQQRMPSPTRSNHQHRTLCLSLRIPSPGWLGAGSNPGRRNFPAKGFSASISCE